MSAAPDACSCATGHPTAAAAVAATLVQARAAAASVFRGNRLVGVLPYRTGARQITITFDAGGSSCSASVIEGHSGGVIRRKGPDGIMHEITNAMTSSVSCSIRSGNAFAE